MNAPDIKQRLAALREKINTGLRAADTTLLHSVPDDIEAIINLVDGKPEPTHQDGTPWKADDDAGYHPAKAGGDPAIDTDVPGKPDTSKPADAEPKAETQPAPADKPKSDDKAKHKA